MTTAPEVFTAKPVVLPAGVPITINGLRLSAENPEGTDVTSETPGYWEETFTSVRALPGAVLDAVSGSVSVDSAGDITAINQAQSIPILRQVLDPESLHRFEVLLKDRDRVVDIATLWGVAMKYVEKLTGRPTGGSGG